MEIANWTDIIYKKLEHWVLILIRMLPNMAIAVLVMTAAYFVSKLVRKISYKIILKISKSDGASSIVSVILQTLVLFLALTLSLQVLKLDKAVSSILAGIGIIGLALGFAFQDLSSNFISGVYMAFRKPFEIGDKVDTNGFTGYIEKVELRSTTLRTLAGLNVIIPNKDIFQKALVNYSRSHERRVELEFSIVNTIDLSFIESIVRKSLQALNAQHPISDIDFYFIGIEDPKIKVHVSFHIDNTVQKGFMTTRHKAIMAIYKAFGENGVVSISVPPPKNAQSPEPKH